MTFIGDDLSDTVFTFGKHRGRTFLDVSENDPHYVSWTKTLANPTGQMLHFCNFVKNIKSKNNLNKSKSKDDPQQGAACTHRIPSPKVTKPRMSQNLDQILDDFAFTGNEDGRNTPLSVYSRILDDCFSRNSAEHFSGEKLSPPLGQRNFKTSPSKFYNVTVDKIGDSVPPQDLLDPMVPNGKRRRVDMTSISTDDNTSKHQSILNISQPLEVDGLLALVLYSESEFYISYRRAINDRFSAWSNYIPSNVFDFLRNLSPNCSLKPIGKEKCLAFPASDYQTVLRGLKRTLRDKGLLDAVPNFVLRAFSAFSQYSRGCSLPEKTVESLSGIQSPYTLSNLSRCADLIGYELYSELKQFQREGVKFGLKRNGRILIGDEMGLGKTLQALAISAFYAADWPLLIVCPSSLRFQWRDQCLRWLSHLLKGEDICVVKTRKTNIPPEIKVIIISYDILTQSEQLGDKFKIVICDESHYLKNRSAKRTKRVTPLLKMAKRAILLSGTPTLNLPSELFEQLSCLMPNFSSNSVFLERYCEKKLNWYTKKMEYTGSKHTHELHLFLVRTVMIRRLKEDVLNELPPKIRSKVPIELPNSFLKQCKDALNSRTSLSGESADENNLKSFQEVFRLTGQAKCKGICEHIHHLLKINIKFIVFAHHKYVMDAIEETLRENHSDFIRIDGSTPLDKREAFVNHFQNDSRCKVALLSMTACGTGLNLTASCTVVFAELYWVPGQMIQAEDRAHRIGTKHRTVNIHYLIAEGSVDETVWKILNRKWGTVTSTLNGETSNLTFVKDPHEKRDIAKQGNQMLIPDFLLGHPGCR